MAGTRLAKKVCCSTKQCSERKKEHRRGCMGCFPFFSWVINRARVGYMLILANVCRNLVNFVKAFLRCSGVGFGQSILIIQRGKALNSP